MKGSYDPTLFTPIADLVKSTVCELEELEWTGEIELAGERFDYLKGRLARLRAKQAAGEQLEPLF